jgi:acetolactate synthase-1/3 small subunit
LTAEGQTVERELALIKVGGTGDHRAETLRLAEAFRAQIVDATVESFVLEITGRPSKIDSFIALMVPLGLIEVVRTGLAAISRGPERM